MASERGRGNSNITNDERTLKQQVQTANTAENLINNETLNKALTNIENNAINALKSTKINDRETRESLFFAIKAIDSLRKELATFINIGATAKTKLENRNDR